MEFIHDRINYPYFTREDLERTVGKRLNKGTPSASTIKSELLDGIYFNNKTMEHYTKKLVQKKFLNQLKQRIIDGEAEDIIEDLYRMVKILGTSNNSFLHLAGDAKEMTTKYGRNVTLLSGLFNATSLTGREEWLSGRYEVSREHRYRAENSSIPHHVALGVDSTSSCYLTQTVMYNNTDWSDKEVARARVLLKYLSDRMYHSVRGKGLTYSISMALSVSTGRVVLSISKSAQLTQAYKVVREIFNNYTQVRVRMRFSNSGHIKLTAGIHRIRRGSDRLLQGSPDLPVGGEGGDCVGPGERGQEGLPQGGGQSLQQSLHRQHRGRHHRADFSGGEEVRLSQVEIFLVTLDTLFRILPLFLDDTKTQTVVVCNSGRVEKIVNDMEEMFGLKFKLYDSFEETFLNYD